MNTTTQRFMSLLGCGSVLVPESLRQKELMRLLLTMQKEGMRRGYTPILVCVGDVLLDTLEMGYKQYGHGKQTQTVTNIMKRANGLNGSALLDTAVQELGDRLAWEFPGLGPDTDPESYFTPAEKPFDMIAFDAYRNFTEALVLARIPTTKPWELAAWVPIGGFSDCPSPAVLAAIFREFYKSHGARPALVTGDQWVLTVDKPIQTVAESYEMVKRFMAFNPDVANDVGGIELVNMLVGSKIWSFWWD